MKLKLFCGAVFAAVLGVSISAPTQAITTPEIMATIAAEEIGTNGALVQFGKNRLYAGESLQETPKIDGLGFFFGNRLELGGQAEYGFAAGNIITYKGKTEKDLFMAGNYIFLNEQAEIGRDVFVTGNTIVVDTDLPGSFSAAASSVNFKNLTIAGDVELDVGEVIFDGQVEIKGKLKINADADISGWSNLTYSEVEKYEAIQYQPTAWDIFTSEMLSIIGLFVTIVIILVAVPKLNRRVKEDLSAENLGKDLLAGVCTLVAVPFLAIFLLISFVGAPAGIVLIVAYLIALYIAMGISGFYLGKALLEKSFKKEFNKFIEAFVGIVILMFLTLIPNFGALISLVAISLGLGIMIRSLHPKIKGDVEGNETSTKTRKVKNGKVAKN